MSALEQSLDAIISKSGNKKPSRRTVKGSKRPQVAPKSLASRSRAPVSRRPIGPSSRQRNVPAPRQQAPKLSAALSQRAITSASLEVATKVVVSGLPKDINNDAIKEFFTSSVGPVQKITLAYNEKGRSTGVATVIFKNAAAARKAVATYNNAPIDSGRSILKLELVVDTTQVPLAARIQPNVQKIQPAALKNRGVAPGPRNQRVNAVKGRPVKPNRVIARTRAAAPKKQPKKKKTLEELDQEMADYFATNDK